MLKYRVTGHSRRLIFFAGVIRMSVIKKLRCKKEPKLPYCSAVIVAAGASSRMGFDKMTATLGNMPVIARSIKVFQDSPCISEIIIVTKSQSVAAMADICRQFGFDKVSKVVEGGKTRTESSLAGVCQVNEKAKLIAIHDGARPLVTEKVIADTAWAAAEKMAAAPGVPTADTIKLADDKGMVTGTVDREHAFAVQTPQIFAADLIKGALSRAVSKELSVTDDCAAVEATGMNVFIVPGDRDNIKLTSPADFYMCEKILSDRGERV